MREGVLGTPRALSASWEGRRSDDTGGAGGCPAPDPDGTERLRLAALSL